MSPRKDDPEQRTVTVLRSGYPSDELWQHVIDRALMYKLIVRAVDGQGRMVEYHPDGTERPG